MGMDAKEFFASTGPTEVQRYKLTEVIGKGSYGVVASAVDQFNNGAFQPKFGPWRRAGSHV